MVRYLASLGLAAEPHSAAAGISPYSIISRYITVNGIRKFVVTLIVSMPYLCLACRPDGALGVCRQLLLRLLLAH